mmetsp:Transcript_12579/g.19000  ORF Transcript_12579/g.19000 Transcript_12579/m.19000 type:complete len:222 (-) Transcript_12579:15-680(-)
MKKICVFGSSSPRTNEKFTKEAYKLGQGIARQGHVCINGAGMHGCMGAVNKGVTDCNGEIIGVSHELFRGGDHRIQNKIVCSGDDLSERRMRLIEQADIVIVLPGGPGTFDELWETSVYRILGLRGMRHIPICVVNIDHYFDGTIMQLQRAHDESLLYDVMEEYFHVENDVEAALAWSLAASDRFRQKQQQEPSNDPTGGGGDKWANAEGSETTQNNKTFY